MRDRIVFVKFARDIIAGTDETDRDELIKLVKWAARREKGLVYCFNLIATSDAWENAFDEALQPQTENEQMLERATENLRRARRALEGTPAWKLMKEYEREVEYWRDLDR